MENKTMLFPNQTCKEIVEKACADAVATCVTYKADIDRALCVQIVDAMLRQLAKALGVSLEKDRARLLAEMQVGSFNSYRLPKLAALPGGKTLYARAKWALVENLGLEACATLSQRVA